MTAAVAFAVAAWAPALGRRWVAWGAVAITGVALPLSLLTLSTKPASVPYLQADGPSIWTDPWYEVLEPFAPTGGIVAALDAIETGAQGPVAVASRENDFLYLFLGHGQENPVTLVPIDGGRVPPEARWLVTPPGVRVVRCGSWRVAAADERWTTWARVGDADRPCTTAASPQE
jgi:hypothetical protein